MMAAISGTGGLSAADADSVYPINLDVPPLQVETGHLDLGGKSPDGHSYTATSYYLEHDGAPFIPVVAEFHYSRYPRQYWEESLRKLKAGGISVVATYVFWNLHEREEGSLDFSADLDLRAFVETCQRVGIPAIIRIGPFCHGEMRNGGLPDWLYGRSFEVRSNDPGYLKYVDGWYAAVGEQLKGLYFKDGGPVIGIQLENEYQHSAAPWEFTYPGAPTELTVANLNRSVTYTQIADSGAPNPHAEYGRQHMRTLKELAQRHGMDVPYYTATGWGNAAIVPLGSLPVSGCYAYLFWGPPRQSPFFLYKDIHSNPDYSPVSYDPTRYPSIMAEMGPGMAVTYKRRPYFDERSLAPLVTRALGSGSNGIGYYMFHGGSTPVFGHYYSEESLGHMKINYDFQAPIGEFGQVRHHFQTSKLVHFFLRDFGVQLAPMRTVLPEAQPQAGDLETLRYAGRTDGSSGFLFMHNFQDHAEGGKVLAGLALDVAMGGANERVPASGSFSLPWGDAAILPLNMPVGTTHLISAMVQPLALLEGAKTRYVFFSRPGMPAELVFPADAEVSATGIAIERVDQTQVLRGPTDKPFVVQAGGAELLVIPQALALQAYKIDAGHLAFSDALLLNKSDSLEMLIDAKEAASVSIYPAIKDTPKVENATMSPLGGGFEGFSNYQVKVAPAQIDYEVRELASGKLQLTGKGAGAGSLNDVYLDIDYLGDRAMAFIDGQLVGDHLYHGRPWQIGLRKFGALQGEGMIINLYPLRKDAEFLREFDPERKPTFPEGADKLLELRDLKLVPQYRVELRLP